MGKIDAACRKPLHLLHQSDGIDYDAICDNAVCAFIKNSGRNQVKHKFFRPVFDCVSRIVSTLKTDNHIHRFCKDINDFALAFVAPL